jgi:deoxyribodipyrimidine photo-lyase
MPLFKQSLVWFRRDLRCFDHAALSWALRHSERVFCVFVFDSAILADLPAHDRRVAFIHACVQELAQELATEGGQLLVRHGVAEQEIPRLVQQLAVDALVFNHDYEPQAITRDQRVSRAVQQAGRTVHSCKDQVVFEKDQILTQSGTPFSVFTPYKNAWLARLRQDPDAALPHHACHAKAGQWGLCDPSGQSKESTQSEQSTQPAHRAPPPAHPTDSRQPQRIALPALAELGFATATLPPQLPPGASGAAQLWQAFEPRMLDYARLRDFPAQDGTSRLSPHLRFGTLSVRHLVRSAWQHGADTFLSELIWREFYQMILYHHPHVVSRAFKPAYDAIIWEQGPAAEADFAAWCQGQTGYPLVDAAMLQLNQTGFMHNRLRMVAASFLIKDLGIDYRRGEAYFALQLNDFDLAANNGGWQWCASSGCDAQPWFRIFNPITQSEKFDPDGQFIAHYLPQLASLPAAARHAPWKWWQKAPAQASLLGDAIDYPPPRVQHEAARERTLARYAVVKAASTTAPE